MIIPVMLLRLALSTNQLINASFGHHDIAEILLKLALNTNQ